MAQYTYRVVPFIGSVKKGGTAEEVAKQLQTVIDQHASDGWELHTFNDVNIEVRPGCVAGLFGAGSDYVRFDQLRFRRGA